MAIFHPKVSIHKAFALDLDTLHEKDAYDTAAAFQVHDIREKARPASVLRLTPVDSHESSESLSSCHVVEETWMRLGMQVLSILDAVLIVSPKIENLGSLEPTIPVTFHS